jgi:hypothetical protein
VSTKEILGSKKNEVKRGCRKSQSYYSPNTIRALKSRTLIWAEEMARRGRGEVHTDFFGGNLRGKSQLSRPRRRWEKKYHNREINWDGVKQDLSGSGYGQVAGSCECGNEPSAPIKRGEFLDWMMSSFSRRTLSHGIVS